MNQYKVWLNFLHSQKHFWVNSYSCVILVFFAACSVYIANNIYSCFKNKGEFTLKDAYSEYSDKPKETVRARIYDNLGIKFERITKGCDMAFESGVTVSAHKRIFTANDATNETRAMARVHKLSIENLLGRKLELYAREVFQILGADMQSLVDFLLCYMRDGCECFETHIEKTGGTGFAIDLASCRQIPVINMRNKGWRMKMKGAMRE